MTELTKTDAATGEAAGWIEWFGGECPLPVGTRVDVRHRDGEEYFNQPCGEMDNASDEFDQFFGAAHDWTVDGADGDIIAYRVVSA